MTQPFRRLASVDAFRALTMFLMIFVNDLGSLRNIPGWLEHAAKTEDRMGLADVVFPAFLFIVGLSIPFAISKRVEKGYSRRSNLLYILTRSFALLVMGFFHVNLEDYNKATAFLPKPLWQIGITVAFFLIWLDYPPASSLRGVRRKRLLQGSGILLLVVLALLYKGTPDGGDSQAGSSVWMQPQWYGILGLIGWSYLLCALVYLYAKDRLPLLTAGLLFFIGFMIANKAGWLGFLEPVRDYIWIISSGSLPVITMTGVLCAVIYRRMPEGSGEKDRRIRSLLVMGILGAVMLAAGFAFRHLWPISKIRATPPWVFICTGISIACFILLAYIMDIKGRQRWIRPLKPAGTSTLTCYLLPYIHYALLDFFGPACTLPFVLRTGGIGLFKSLLYALLIVWITGMLEKRRIRLSI